MFDSPNQSIRKMWVRKNTLTLTFNTSPVLNYGRRRRIFLQETIAILPYVRHFLHTSKVSSLLHRDFLVIFLHDLWRVSIF